MIKPEHRVISAALLASDLLCALLGSTEEELLSTAKQNATQLLTSTVYLAKDGNKFKIGKSRKDIEALGDRMGPGGLIEGWVVTEEMKLEALNKDPKASCDLMMLKSDFILDLAETLFKHQK